LNELQITKATTETLIRGRGFFDAALFLID